MIENVSAKVIQRAIDERATKIQKVMTACWECGGRARRPMCSECRKKTRVDRAVVEALEGLIRTVLLGVLCPPGP